MSDQQNFERPGSAADRKMTPMQTMALTGGTAAGAIDLIYFVSCVKAHALLTPTTEQALALLAVGGPFLHQLGRIVMYWLSKLGPKDAQS